MSLSVTIFDPLFLLVALVAVSLGFSKNYIIPLTAVFLGLLAETLAMKATPGHQWGESFPTMIASGIIQTIIAYFIVAWRRKRKNRCKSELTGA